MKTTVDSARCCSGARMRRTMSIDAFDNRDMDLQPLITKRPDKMVNEPSSVSEGGWASSLAHTRLLISPSRPPLSKQCLHLRRPRFGSCGLDLYPTAFAAYPIYNLLGSGRAGEATPTDGILDDDYPLWLDCTQLDSRRP